MDKLKEFMGTLSRPRILDVGTGNGNFIRLLTSVTDNFSEIVGIDSLKIAVETSSKNFSDDRISFAHMNALDIKFNDDSFDVVCLSNSLHHLSDVKSIIAEMERVLKPGGVIIVNEMMKDHLSAKQITHLKLHHFAAEIDRELGDTHNETFNREEIIEVLKENSSLTIFDYWDMYFERPETNSDEEIEWLLNTVDRLVNRLKDEEQKKIYTDKGERIKEYVKKVGFDSATQLLVILK